MTAPKSTPTKTATTKATPTKATPIAASAPTSSAPLTMTPIPAPRTHLAEDLAAAFSPEAERVLNKGGTYLTYIPVSEVIARLNRVLGVQHWSFEVVNVHRDALDPDFVIAHVRLSATIDGITVVKDGVGGQPVKRKKNGEIVDLGDEFKGAVSDALKKAAQQLGVGLYLARDDDAMDAENALENRVPDPVAHLDPEIQDKWTQMGDLVAGLDEDQRELLNDFWADHSNGRPKPTLATATHDDLDALIEECVRLNLDAELVG